MTLVPTPPGGPPSVPPPVAPPAAPPVEPPIESHGAPPPDRRSRRIRIARIIAIGADAIQLLFIPFFAGGVLSPVNDALDVAIGLVMVWLVGWHIAFLPTFIAELAPVVDLFPSWTAAVWFVTRGRGGGRPRSG
jgi:hypothetical protein